MTISYPYLIPGQQSNPALFVANATGVLGAYNKALDEVPEIIVDYTKLIAGVTIVSLWTVRISPGGEPQLEIAYPTLASKMLTFTLYGGIAGCTYTMLINTASDQGNIRSDVLTVNVQGDDCGSCQIVVPAQGINQVSGDGGVFINTSPRFFVSGTPPVGANVLDRWYETSNGLIYDFVTNGLESWWEQSANSGSSGYGAVVVKMNPITPDGVTTGFILTATDGTTVNIPSPNTLLVSVDGVWQEPVTQYEASGNQVVFAQAPFSDAVVFMLWLSSPPALLAVGGEMGYALPSGVVNTNSLYLYPAHVAGQLGPYVKQVSDQTLVVVDYSTISPAITVTGYGFALDVSSNPALVVSFSNIATPGTSLLFLLSGGIVGQKYNLEISINYSTASSGFGARIDTLVINIPSSGDCGCETINSVPAIYTQLPLGEPTQGYVNSAVRYFWGAAAPANPNVMDQWMNPNSETLSEWVTDGKTFFWETMMSPDLVVDASPNNVIYGRYNNNWVMVPIQADAPSDGRSYARFMGSWTTIPTIIPDAPSNGTIYGRSNNAWLATPIQADVPNTGQAYARSNTGWVTISSVAGIPEAPNNGQLYGRINLGWALAYSASNPAGYQTAAQVTAALLPYALITSLPIGSNASPLMDGTVAPGSSVAYSRADHVHPSDMSRVPLAGGTMTGMLTLASNPVNVLDAVPKQYVDVQANSTIDMGTF